MSLSPPDGLIDWNSMLTHLIPLVIHKHNLSPKQLTSKKLWDKMKDIRLYDIGFSEAILDNVFKVFCNNYAGSKTSQNPNANNIATPLLEENDGTTCSVSTVKSPAYHSHSSPNVAMKSKFSSLITSSPRARSEIPSFSKAIDISSTVEDSGTNTSVKGDKLDKISNTHNSFSEPTSPTFSGRFTTVSSSSPARLEDNDISGVSTPLSSVKSELGIRSFRQKLNSYKSSDSEATQRNTASYEDHSGILTDTVRVNTNKVDQFKARVEERYNAAVNLTNNNSSSSNNNNSDVRSEFHKEDLLIDDGGVLNMTEVFEDSPMFRQKIKMVENNIQEFSEQLKKVIKLSKDSCHVGIAMNNDLTSLSEKVSDLRENYNLNIKEEQVLENALTQFSKGLRDIETLRSALFVQVQTTFIDPMDLFLKDIRDVKDCSKKLDKYSARYEAMQARHTRFYTKKVESELLTNKNKMLLSVVDLVFRLNELEKRKKFQHLESVCQYMLMNYTFFEQAFKTYQQMESTIKEVFQLLMQKRSHFEEIYKQMKRKRLTIEHMVINLPFNSKGTTRQGYLFKRTGNVHLQWKKRFFIVDQGVMIEKKELSTVNCFPLLTCSVKARPDIDARCFEVVSPSKNYIMQADSAEGMNEWISVLQNVIAQQLNSQEIKRPSSYHPSSLSSNLSQENSNCNVSVEAVGGGGGGGRLTNVIHPAFSSGISPSSSGLSGSTMEGNSLGNSQENDWKPIELVRKASQENYFCADCGAEDAEWASINLGIFTCIECSGIHRSLGVHISKMRSLHLDKWDPDVLNFVISIGNVRANQIFEFRVQAPWSKPLAKSDRDSKEKWIRAKYQQKLFIDPSKPVDIESQFYLAATVNDHLKLLRLLMQGADIDFQNRSESNQTALHAALASGSFASVQLLTLNRSNIGIVDVRGRNAFHYAAEYGNPSAIIFLFKNCENKELVDSKDSEGKTPLDLAIENNQIECKQIIIDLRTLTKNTSASIQ